MVDHLHRPPAYHAGMLRELSVQNLALIEDVRVELHPGFCAWTGETGAGKSLLLGALGLLLGERGSADLIRAGAEELRVTGRFELTRPEQRAAAEEILQTTLDEDDLILTRRLSRSGRSSALVNEQPVAVATLRRLGEMLVDVHGQRESYSLLQPAYQLELLDAFGKLTDLREAVRRRRGPGARAAATAPRTVRGAGRPGSGSWRWSASSGTNSTRPQLEAGRAGGAPEGAGEAVPRAVAGGVHRRRWRPGWYDDEGSVAAVLGRLIKEAGKWAGLDPKLAEVSQRLERPQARGAGPGRDVPRPVGGVRGRPRAAGRDRAAAPGSCKKLEAKYGKTVPDLIAYRATLDAQETRTPEAGGRPRRHRRRVADGVRGAEGRRGGR